MSYFPVNNDEISLIKFIAKYQYLNVKDAKYFFNSSRYYRNRIKALIDKKFLRKIKWTLVNINGFEYLTYQILEQHDNKYIESVAYDIQKEMKYGNFIILVNDINRINLDEFAFWKE